MVEENGKLTCDLDDLTVDTNEGEHAAVQGFLFGAKAAARPSTSSLRVC